MNFIEWILIQISLKFILGGQIDNKYWQLQLAAVHQTGDRLLPEPMTSAMHVGHLGSLLLTWFNFNSSMDK